MSPFQHDLYLDILPLPLGYPIRPFANNAPAISLLEKSLLNIQFLTPPRPHIVKWKKAVGKDPQTGR